MWVRSWSTSVTTSWVAFSRSFSMRCSSRSQLAGLLERLELLPGVAADVAHGDPALLGLVLDDLHHLLAPLLGELGNTSRTTWPSLLGLMPRSLCWIAFSIAPIAPLS